MIADDSLEFVKKDITNFGIGVIIFIIIHSVVAYEVFLHYKTQKFKLN